MINRVVGDESIDERLFLRETEKAVMNGMVDIGWDAISQDTVL